MLSLAVAGAPRGAPSASIGSIQPFGLADRECSSVRVIATFNMLYAHVMANFVTHLHHMEGCVPPVDLLTLDEGSLTFCNSLLTGQDIRSSTRCVPFDCPMCNSVDAKKRREGVSFTKFFALQMALHREPMHAQEMAVLYLDGTSLVQGPECLAELASHSADVVLSSEVMSPGCPTDFLAPELGANANTGLIWCRRSREVTFYHRACALGVHAGRALWNWCRDSPSSIIPCNPLSSLQPTACIPSPCRTPDSTKTPPSHTTGARVY